MSTLSVQNITGILSLNQIGTINAASLKANTRDVNGWEMISPPTSLGTGTTYTISNIPPEYNDLRVVYGNLSHSSVNPAYIQVETSNNGGTVWHTGPIQMGQAGSPGANVTSYVEMINTGGELGTSMYSFGMYGTYYYRHTARTDIAAVTNIRLSMNAGNFVTGTAALYGKKFQVS